MNHQLNETAMETGYQVKQIKNRFIVIFKYSDGEEMVMINKSWATENGATKAMNEYKRIAGA